MPLTFLVFGDERTDDLLKKIRNMRNVQKQGFLRHRTQLGGIFNLTCLVIRDSRIRNSNNTKPYYLKMLMTFRVFVVESTELVKCHLRKRKSCFSISSSETLTKVFFHNVFVRPTQDTLRNRNIWFIGFGCFSINTASTGGFLKAEKIVRLNRSGLLFGTKG